MTRPSVNFLRQGLNSLSTSLRKFGDLPRRQPLKSEFVVLQISAMRDGSPNVVLTLVEGRIVRLEKGGQCDLLYPHRYHHHSDQDCCMNSVADLNEYASSGLKVGDMVTVELRKSKERKLDFARPAEQGSRRREVGPA